MTLDFQKQLLQYLVQIREGRKFVGLLTSDVFDLPQHQVLLEALSNYIEKYGIQPSKPNFTEYIDRELTKSGDFPEDVYSSIEKELKFIYTPFKADTEMIKDVLVEEIQRKLTKALLVEAASKVKTGDSEYFDTLMYQMSKIVNLAKELEDEVHEKGSFLVEDYTGHLGTVVDGHATFIKGVNAMTAAKGFHSPQLVIFMGAPKSFKTGTLLNIALEYARDGYKVFYVDNENGLRSLRARFYQALLETTRDKLNEKDEKVILKQIMKKFKVMKGDVFMEYFPAYASTTQDVENHLDKLKDENGWEPDIICWDYPDLLMPVDKTVKEKRLQIQHVYHDIIRLNNKRSVFSIGLSQVSKLAVNAEVIDMTHFAEDFGKAMNCHAAFALCATEVEQAAGIRRILPVVQREGVQYNKKNYAIIKIDAPTMNIKELGMEEANVLVDAARQEAGFASADEGEEKGPGRKVVKNDLQSLKIEFKNNFK